MIPDPLPIASASLQTQVDRTLPTSDNCMLTLAVDVKRLAFNAEDGRHLCCIVARGIAGFYGLTVRGFGSLHHIRHADRSLRGSAQRSDRHS